MTTITMSKIGIILGRFAPKKRFHKNAIQQAAKTRHTPPKCVLYLQNDAARIASSSVKAAMQQRNRKALQVIKIIAVIKANRLKGVWFFQKVETAIMTANVIIPK